MTTEQTDNKGYSEETCIRCGWRMGSPAMNCQNNDTPHIFPSQIIDDEAVTVAKEKGLPFALDYIGYDGLGNLANNLFKHIAELVTLVRVGFLVRIDGERATVDTVREPELHELLRTILQAKDTEEAVHLIERKYDE